MQAKTENRNQFVDIMGWVYCSMWPLQGNLLQ